MQLGKPRVADRHDTSRGIISLGIWCGVSRDCELQSGLWIDLDRVEEVPLTDDPRRRERRRAERLDALHADVVARLLEKLAPRAALYSLPELKVTPWKSPLAGAVLGLPERDEDALARAVADGEDADADAGPVRGRGGRGHGQEGEDDEVPIASGTCRLYSTELVGIRQPDSEGIGRGRTNSIGFFEK